MPFAMVISKPLSSQLHTFATISCCNHLSLLILPLIQNIHDILSKLMDVLRVFGRGLRRVVVGFGGPIQLIQVIFVVMLRSSLTIYLVLINIRIEVW